MTLSASGGYRAGKRSGRPMEDPGSGDDHIGQRAAVWRCGVRFTDARALRAAEGFVQHERTAGDVYSAQVARAVAACTERDHFGRVPVRNDVPIATEAALREPERRTSAVDVGLNRLGE